MKVYRVHEVDIHTAPMIDETGVFYTLTPIEPTDDTGRYEGEVNWRGRVFEFAPGVLIEVYETKMGETAFRCRWIGRTHVFLGDELLDDRGNCIDSLLGRTRELQDGDEIEE